MLPKHTHYGGTTCLLAFAVAITDVLPWKKKFVRRSFSDEVQKAWKNVPWHTSSNLRGDSDILPLAIAEVQLKLLQEAHRLNKTVKTKWVSTRGLTQALQLANLILVYPWPMSTATSG